MRNNPTFIKSVQELLDAGYSRNKTSEILGVYHAKIDRLLERNVVESYVAFDEHIPCSRKIDRLEWLEEEDALEEITRQAFENDFYLIRDSDDARKTGKYVRDKYGSLSGYLKDKKLTPLGDCIFVQCYSCGGYKTLDDWYEHRKRLWGLAHECPSCRSEISMRYFRNNPHVAFKYSLKRRLMAELLPNTLSKDEWLRLMKIFNWRCAYSKQRNNLSIDHFIPIVSGHCGTYIGNLVPMKRTLNSSKREKHPLDWFDTQFSDKRNLDEILDHLSIENALNVPEYIRFIDWCFENKRELNEVYSDTRYSIEIWREATGLQFPLPKYALNEIGNRSTEETTAATVIKREVM
jgi:hypothetical protein